MHTKQIEAVYLCGPKTQIVMGEGDIREMRCILHSANDGQVVTFTDGTEHTFRDRELVTYVAPPPPPMCEDCGECHSTYYDCHSGYDIRDSDAWGGTNRYGG